MKRNLLVFYEVILISPLNYLITRTEQTFFRYFNGKEPTIDLTTVIGTVTYLDIIEIKTKTFDYQYFFRGEKVNHLMK